MARYIWGVLCSDVIVDALTGEVSYIKAVEQLQPEELPIQLPEIYAAVSWKKEEDEQQARIRMRALDPEGEEFATTEEGDLDFGDSLWWRSRFPLFTLSVENPGVHEFIVEQFVDDGWRTEAVLPLEILPPPAEEDASEASSESEVESASENSGNDSNT